MIAVTSTGGAVPCMQASGLLTQLDIHLGNLHRDKLKDLLTAGDYLDNVCATVGELRESNQKCGSCKWFEYCTGGCRAMGLLYSGERVDFCGEDITKCRFMDEKYKL